MIAAHLFVFTVAFATRPFSEAFKETLGATPWTLNMESKMGLSSHS